MFTCCVIGSHEQLPVERQRNDAEFGRDCERRKPGVAISIPEAFWRRRRRERPTHQPPAPGVELAEPGERTGPR
jgi:hypothetical protein